MAKISQDPFIAIGLALVVLILSPVQSVLTADITVDAECSLTEAINAANRDSDSGGCASGDGADTIHLTGDYRLVSALPAIASDITFEGNGYSINGNGAQRIFDVLLDATLSLRNVTLLNGRADRGGAIFNLGKLHIEDSSFSGNTAYESNGGAIYNAGHLTISNSVFADNIADRLGDVTSSGGAIYNDGSDGGTGELTVSDSSFQGNWAEWGGGAINNAAGVVTISHSAFENNSADGFGGALDNDDRMTVSGSSFIANSSDRGGAIDNMDQLTVSISQFTGNLAEDFGGAISNKGEADVSDSNFTDNQTENSGGAINNDNAKLKVSGSSFSGNASKWGGAINSRDDVSSQKADLLVLDSAFVANTAEYGGAINANGAQRITGSSFTANTSTLIGGAISSSAGQLSVSNSSFSANKTELSGGAISLSNTVGASLSHLTLVENAAEEGGGIFVYRRPGDEALAALHNSLIADSDGGDCSAVLAQASGNFIADGSCEPDADGDPLLGALLVPEDGSPAYYPLLAGSPAIDAADPDYCEATDQTGMTRPQGVACDIGAVELTHD